MKIYFPHELIFHDRRSEIFPLLKPFLKPKSFSDNDRIRMYRISKNDFSFVNDIELSDIIILPMSWNYYHSQGKIDAVKNFIKENKSSKILSWIAGDFTVTTPNYRNLYIIHDSGYKSKLSTNHIAKPPFIVDPLKLYYNTETLLPIKFNKTPIVGFCGQSNISYINAFKECSRVIIRNISYFLKLSHNHPHKVMSSSLLRSTVLKKIKDSKLIIDNFIERDKYRAGAYEKDMIQKTTEEFYNNIRDSHYIVCCRGGGNFSVRLYETIAMGRIPIFINTDCLLPYHDEWKYYAVWVERKNLNNLENMLISFHSKFNEESFKQYLNEIRAFWLKKMSLKHYFLNVINQIGKTNVN